MAEHKECESCHQLRPTRKTQAEAYGIKDTFDLCSECGLWDPEEEES